MAAGDPKWKGFYFPQLQDAWKTTPSIFIGDRPQGATTADGYFHVSNASGPQFRVEAFFNSGEDGLSGRS
jgi:hypothetical protein